MLESFVDLQGSIPLSCNKSETKRNESREEPKISKGREPCGWRVMNIKRPSPLRASGQGQIRSTLTEGENRPKAIYMSGVVTTIRSSDFTLENMTSMDCTPVCRVSLVENRRTLSFQQVKNIMSFLKDLNRSFWYWRNWKSGKTIEQLCQQLQYHVKQSRRREEV